MLNKILVFGGIALLAILIVENVVIPNRAFVFIDSQSTGWMLSIVSSLIGIGVGYGLCRMMNDKGVDDEGLDF